MEMDARQTIACTQHLLCRRYLVGCLDKLPISVEQEGCNCEYELYWAFGALADGPSEVLGAWLALRSASGAWEEAFDDLKARGAEHIRVVVSVDLEESLAHPEAFPGAVWTTPTRLATEQLPPRVGRVFRQCKVSAAMVHSWLRRFIAKHACFSSPKDAARAIAATLQDAERRLDVVLQTAA